MGHRTKLRRILHITRVGAGGVVVVVDRIVRGLDKNRYEPSIIFYTHESSHIREKLLQSDIKNIALFEHCAHEPSIFNKAGKRRDIGGWINCHFGERLCQIYLSLKAFIKFVLQDLREVRLFMRTIRDHKIDLLHSHTCIDNGKPECIAAWLSGIPCIIHNHRYPKYNYFDRFFFRFADQFIHISSDLSEYHIDSGTSPQKGNIIHNGVEISPYIRKYDTALIRRELSVKQD